VRLSVEASPSEVASLPGVVSSLPVNGEYVLALEPGTDRREFLSRALERYRVDSFSQKEPELEEIYLEAVREAGLQETRTVD
jgi:ABC-type uncharacterized transport system ATPase subunit